MVTSCSATLKPSRDVWTTCTQAVFSSSLAEPREPRVDQIRLKDVFYLGELHPAKSDELTVFTFTCFGQSSASFSVADSKSVLFQWVNWGPEVERFVPLKSNTMLSCLFSGENAGFYFRTNTSASCCAPLMSWMLQFHAAFADKNREQLQVKTADPKEPLIESNYHNPALTLKWEKATEFRGVYR